MADIKLTVTMEGVDRKDLLTRLDAQAKQFFGDTPHRRSGPVEVTVLEEVRTVAGQQVMAVWEGTASYEDLP